MEEFCYEQIAMGEENPRQQMNDIGVDENNKKKEANWSSNHGWTFFFQIHRVSEGWRKNMINFSETQKLFFSNFQNYDENEDERRREE